MMTFKQFLTESEDSYKSEIKKTISKLPAKHAALIKGFKYEFQSTSTLKNDNEHVGLIDTKRKKIIIAAPWFYGREWILLHELGHMIYATLDINLKNKWAKIVKNTKMKKEDRQNAEELFCHSYSCYYAKNKITKFDFPEWRNFIKGLN
jgi:hypothetical protein